MMSFCINHEKLLENNKTILPKIEHLKNIQLISLPVYDKRYIKTKIRDKIYIDLCGLNVPEDGAEFKSFAIISIDYLYFYENKCYLQVYLDNCTYKTVNTEMFS